MLPSNIVGSVGSTVVSKVAVVEPLVPESTEHTPKFFVFPNPEEERNYIQTTAEVQTTQILGDKQRKTIEIRHVTDLSEGTISGELPKMSYNIDLDIIDKSLPWLNRGVVYHQKTSQNKGDHVYQKIIHRKSDTTVKQTSQLSRYVKIAPKPS